MSSVDETSTGVLAELGALWAEALDIWTSGGWAMIALAAVALMMFGVGMQLFLRLRRKGFRSVSEQTWREWINHPEEREGPIGKLLDFVTGGRKLEDTSAFFVQLRMTETMPIERELKVMKVCVSAAPLVGLLGTVTGMLATFGALSTGSGGDKTMGMIAEGISEALITTETGLVIALPGLFFQYQLSRTFEAYQAFLAHLETVCSQKHYRQIRREKQARIEREARKQVAESVVRRLRGGQTATATS